MFLCAHTPFCSVHLEYEYFLCHLFSAIWLWNILLVCFTLLGACWDSGFVSCYFPSNSKILGRQLWHAPLNAAFGRQRQGYLILGLSFFILFTDLFFCSVWLRSHWACIDRLHISPMSSVWVVTNIKTSSVYRYVFSCNYWTVLTVLTKDVSALSNPFISVF